MSRTRRETPVLESLESRRLMSVSVANGVVTVDGTPANDTISVYKNSSGNVVVSDNGTTYSYNPSSIWQVKVFASGGHDTVTGYNTMLEQLVLYGGSGNDTLRGGGASDSIHGEAGNDRIEGRSGNDHLSGGADADTADYASATANLNISLDGVANDTGVGADNVLADVENVLGGAGNDYIVGNSAPNYIEGAGGDDSLYGLGGNDILDGGVAYFSQASNNGGDDSLFGGADNDILYASDTGDCSLSGHTGNDSLYGFGGNDTLNAGSGNDSAMGGAANDVLWGDAGIDTLKGEDGNDAIAGEGDADSLYGGYGYDTISGGTGNDYMTGDGDNDTVMGEDGNDTLWGGTGADTLYGGNHADQVNGQSGLDGLFGGSGTDTLDGGTGADRLLDFTWIAGGQRQFGCFINGLTDADAWLGFENAGPQTVTFAGQSGSYSFAGGAWTDYEVHVVDGAFAALHYATQNTKLLKLADGVGTQIFYRAGAQTGGTGTFTSAAWNSGSSITFVNATFSNDTSIRSSVIHELGHNHDAYQPLVWQGLSGWTTLPAPWGYTQGLDASGQWWYLNGAQFSTNYAKTNPHEDFCESFAAYFLTRNGWLAGSGYTVIGPKDLYMANMVQAYSS